MQTVASLAAALRPLFTTWLEETITIQLPRDSKRNRTRTITGVVWHVTDYGIAIRHPAGYMQYVAYRDLWTQEVHCEPPALRRAVLQALHPNTDVLDLLQRSWTSAG